MGRRDERWTHRTAVVFIPPRDVWDPIQAIRRAHDRQFQRWMPHFTLLYPFAPRTELDALLPSLRQACTTQHAFEISLAEFGTFVHRSGGATLWLRPEPHARLVELQQALLSAAPEFSHTSRFAGGFKAHLSVGQAQGRAEADALLTQIQSSWSPLRFAASEVQIIAREANGPFEVIATLSLAPNAVS